MKTITNIIIIYAAFAFVALATGTFAQQIKPDETRRIALNQAYGKLPLSFEANQGQTEPQVQFLSRGQGYSLFLTKQEAVLALTKSGNADSSRPNGPAVKRQSIVLRAGLIGANASAKVTGEQELPGKANYFIGNDPEKWRTNVPTYAKVRYEKVYPGIDLVYYGNQRQLEYDFVVAPGADPKRIRFHVSGAQKMRLDEQGALIVWTTGGELRWEKPLIYQEVDGKRSLVEGKLVLRRGHKVGFKVAAYDTSKSLVIDPTLVYSTYLGGSDSDVGTGIAVDSLGNAYLAIQTNGPNFPTTVGAFRRTFSGGGDAAVAKLDPIGSTLLYSTYIGGSGGDTCFAIAVDAAQNAYVTGGTNSSDFPTTPGAFQTTLNGGGDAFITKLSSSGSALVYSTYLGGSGAGEGGYGLAVDSAGNAYVLGITDSVDVPVTTGAFQTSYAGGSDNFVAKLNPLGSALVYCTYLGGSGFDEPAQRGLAIDSAGSAYVTGLTESANFPTTPGAFQTTNAGARDTFVTKLDPSGSTLVYSTYLGGSGNDANGYGGVAVDSSGNAYVTGATGSNDFPVTAGAYQTSNAGGLTDVFITKLNPTGSGLIYSTYLGGSGEDGGFGVAVDSAGRAWVAGLTYSSNFPTTGDAFQGTYGGNRDAFVTILNTTGSALLYSTYLGGSDYDNAEGVTLDSAGNAYVIGQTGSSDFPTTNGAYQTSYGGNGDAFVAKFATNQCVPPPPGLVGWWPGDGNANDIQAGNNGTLHGGTTFATGKVGEAFSFDGTGYVDASDANLPVGNSSATISAWIKVTQAGHEQFFVSWGSRSYGCYPGNEIGLGVLNNGHLALENCGGNVQGAAIVDDGAWHHVVGVWYGSNVATVYVDGVQQMDVSPQPLPSIYIISSGHLNIGQLVQYGDNFTGLVDEVQIFNRALSAAEILAIYTAGSSGECKPTPTPTPTPTATYTPTPTATATFTPTPTATATFTPTATATATATATPTATSTPTPTPTPTPGCQLATSITANFNGTAINAGRYIWFNSVLKPSGLPTNQSVTIRFTNQTITSSAFTLSVPDATVIFDPAATSATTTFVGGMPVTRVPSFGLAGNTFFSALSYLVPVTIPGGLHNISWSGTISSDTPGVSVQWKWAAAVYTNFSSDYNAIGVKPVDDNNASIYKNSDHAGTPENFKSSVIGGAMGGGGSNYTGSYGGTVSVGPCPH